MGFVEHRKRKPRGQRKITCSKCGQPLDENRVGKQRYCKKCHASNMRKTRLRIKRSKRYNDLSSSTYHP